MNWCWKFPFRKRQRQAAVRNIARILDDDISEEKPLLDSRLPDGPRVAAVLGPTSVRGTILCIRKFRSKLFTAQKMVRMGLLSISMLAHLRQAIEARHTILISGGTGTGKTTFAECARGVSSSGRARSADRGYCGNLDWDSESGTAGSARARPDIPAVTIRDLLRQTLRLRPDRIILGEVRGAEAFDLL